MVSIPPEDWHLLPDVPPGRDSVNLTAGREVSLERGGVHHRSPAARDLLRGGSQGDQLERHPRVTGVDGVERRWVYLHYFKDGQPSINWLDPSFAGMRLVIGDALHALADLGSGALRLDANGFLGVEKSAEGLPGVVGGSSPVGSRQPADRQHDPQDGRVLVPGAQSDHRRHPDDVGVRGRSVV